MQALLSDLDRTLTDETLVLHPAIPEAIAALRREGILTVLVTGRSLDHLLEHGYAAMFDALVAENGAVVCAPSTSAPEIPHAGFADAARKAVGALPDVTWGRVVGSAPRELAPRIEEALRAGGVANALIPNANEIMILPPAVEKAMGARRALHLLGAADARTWAIGDGENDIPLLEMADVAAVAQNAHPAAAAVASLHLPAAHGEAFLLLVEKMLAAEAEARAGRASARR